MVAVERACVVASRARSGATVWSVVAVLFVAQTDRVEALSWKETCKKLMAVVKTHTGWNGTLLAAIHDAFDEHYNDVNTKSIIEEKPRKQQKMQAIYADIDAVLMDRD